MKKNIIIAALLLLALGSVQAQDTLVSPLPRSGYFYNTWVPNTGGYAKYRSLMAMNGYVQAIFFHTPDTLPVYGIAAALEAVKADGTDEWASSIVLLDTTMKEVYEYLGLYKYEGDTLRTVSDSLQVHMSDSVSYYYRPDIGNPMFAEDSFFHVYERYFDTPVMMTDTFLVGMTMRTSWKRNPPYNTPKDTFYYRQVCWEGLRPGGLVDTNLMGMVKWYNEVFDSVVYQFISDNNRIWNRQDFAGRYPLIFPILLPQDSMPDNPIDTTIIDTTIIDTTTIDTTSVGIGDVQLVGRYVSLLPNPATERVKVLSSFGLRRVEIYNAAGARVRQEELRGYTATLRVDDLPEGAYLLRIHTPAGNTTKKLIVRR